MPYSASALMSCVCNRHRLSLRQFRLRRTKARMRGILNPTELYSITWTQNLKSVLCVSKDPNAHWIWWFLPSFSPPAERTVASRRIAWHRVAWHRIASHGMAWPQCVGTASASIPSSTPLESVAGRCTCLCRRGTAACRCSQVCSEPVGPQRRRPTAAQAHSSAGPQRRRPTAAQAHSGVGPQRRRPTAA
jgi:hypothetical protein